MSVATLKEEEGSYAAIYEHGKATGWMGQRKLSIEKRNGWIQNIKYMGTVPMVALWQPGLERC